MNNIFRWRVRVLIGVAMHTLLACRAGAISGVARTDQQSQDFFRLVSNKSISANPGARTEPMNDTQSQLITPEIDNWISNLLLEWNSPGGLSVAVVKLGDDDEWTVETKGYGLAREDGTKVDETTLFGIASNTKVCHSLHILRFCCIDGCF
jgi:CubicO group peptidase (beta-lactamase class C family)